MKVLPIAHCRLPISSNCCVVHKAEGLQIGNRQLAIGNEKMDSLLKDIRYGLRGLLKRPGFTAIALVALALGIGANTAIFSLVNAVVLRPLPFPESDQLVWVYGNIRNGGSRASVSPPDFIDYRAQNKTFEQFAASGTLPQHRNLTGGGEPERLTDRKSTRLNSSHGYISY